MNWILTSCAVLAAMLAGCACPGEGSGSATASARIEASAGGEPAADAPPAAEGDECDPSECGPQMGMPNHVCPDGTTVAGPSNRCLRREGGGCGWEVIECPA